MYTEDMKKVHQHGTSRKSTALLHMVRTLVLDHISEHKTSFAE